MDKVSDVLANLFVRGKRNGLAVISEICRLRDAKPDPVDVLLPVNLQFSYKQISAAILIKYPCYFW